MLALLKPWKLEGDGGEWRILSTSGDIIADGIPYGAYAEHIVRQHNDFLNERANVEARLY